MTFDSVGGGYTPITNYRHHTNGGDVFGGPYSIPTPSGNHSMILIIFALNYLVVRL